MSTIIDKFDAQALSSRLKEERKRLGLTQAEFGSAGGVGRATQCLYEAGERQPNAEYLAGISAIGCDLYFLISGERGAKSDADISLSKEELETALRLADELSRDDRGRLLDLEHRIALSVAICRAASGRISKEVDWQNVRNTAIENV